MNPEQSDPQLLPESSYPYAVRVSLTLGSDIELLMKDPEVRFPFAEDHVIRIVQEPTNSREQANFLKRISIHLEAFSSACEAEQAGMTLALSLLWFATSKRVSLKFERWTGSFPFSVRDRTRSSGMEMRAEGHSFWEVKPEEFHAIAEKAFKLHVDVPPFLLTSMEFFAAARLEITEQARFISLMTALEALSVQQDYGEEVSSLLTELARQIESFPLLLEDGNESLRNSLSCRLQNLRQESVRQAIVRTVRQHLSDKEIIRFVDETYGIRSKILHEGLKVANLDVITHRLEDVIRQLYSSILGLPLSEPAQNVTPES